MTRTAVQSRRSRTSCSIIALATVMTVGATPAAAQSFNGSGTYVTNGIEGGITTAPNTTNIALNGGQTIIDWTPTDNAVNPNVGINFQNSGTTAVFTGSSDFSVLNRILPSDISRAIVMNGAVQSRIGSGESFVQGGNVYFYSPSGFVFGGASSFSVGSLVVTALNPVLDGNNNFIVNNTVQFGQALNPNAAISFAGTVSGSKPGLGFIPPGMSYVALVAPAVNHTGSINVDGSAALVGAEAATINFSPDGLFDIQVTVGTTSSYGVNVNGDIGGPTPTGGDDRQGVYLVAVPKNEALTLVAGVGSDLGFTLAGSAAVDDNGVVVLSAGHNINDGMIAERSAAHSATGLADFWFTGAQATNDLTGHATGTAYLYSAGTGEQLLTTFDNDVFVSADNSVQVQSFVPGALVDFGGDVYLSSDRSVTGTSVTGGFTTMFANNGGAISIDGDLTMTASSVVAEGGSALGGSVNLSASNGTITVGNGETGGDVNLYAYGEGGQLFEGAGISGNGTGGNISVAASSGGDITINGYTQIFADGIGGTTWDNSATGGTGQGGNVNVNVGGAGSTLSLNGALISANGEGGGPGEGSCCVANGGDGLGGLVSVLGSSGGLIQSNGTLEFSAAGSGAYGSVTGGDGIGGLAANGDGVIINAQAGFTFGVTGDLWLDGTGSGGDSDGTAGNGTGGRSVLHVNGGTVNVTGEINVDADGAGGEGVLENEGVSSGDGGIGTGGFAEILTSGSTAQLNAFGDVLVEADGTGGDSFNLFEGPLGDGGDGNGGQARVVADGGLIHIRGELAVHSVSTGGSGAIGGDATGLVTLSTNEGGPTAALLWAGTTGAQLRVDGLTDIDISATGGDGLNGNGGNASGGEADIVSRLGTVTLGTVTANAEAHGGHGSFGGSGGNAAGGAVDVSWALSDGPLTGTISLGTVNLALSGHGGNGGGGINANTGGAGGAGGNGTAGGASYVGNAVGGTLNVGATTITADGRGGAGGAGGSGDTGAGGNGGNGGIGTGGFIQTGTISLETNPGSGGSATFTTLSASSNAFGGAGGSGGQGGGGTGIGGNGGNAVAGQATFLIRGVAATANSVSLFANATGGNGGAGSTVGIGGNALAGFVSAESKDRFGHPTQRGTLTANSITGTAIAQGGTGASNGTSTVRGGSFFRVLNGDATIGSVNFQFTGTNYDGTSGPNYIQAEAGTANIGTLSYSTSGELAIYTTNTGTLNVGNLTLLARNFIDHPTLVGPASPGTIFANSLSVTTGNNFFADANLDVDNGIAITAPGSIQFDNATSASSIVLGAQAGSITVDNVAAGGNVSLQANANVLTAGIGAGTSVFGRANGTFTTGAINAGSFIDIRSGGALTLGNLAAGDYIDLRSSSPISIFNAISGETINFQTTGTLTTGNLTAGNNILGQAAGAINVGALSAGLVDPSTASGAQYRVSLASDSNITTANVSALGNIGFGTPAHLLTGSLSSGGGLMALVGGNMQSGAVSATQYVYIANHSMSALGGTFENFDRAPILASAPVPTGGSIMLGDVNTGAFTAAAGTALTTGNMVSSAGIGLGAGGAITTGNLTAGDFVLANGGSITTGTINADSVDMTSTGGNITTSHILASGAVEMDAFGNIQSGNVNGGSIALLARGPVGISTSALTAAGNIGLMAPANITTGDISAGGTFIALAHGNMSFGNATASEVFLADFALVAPGGGNTVTANCVGTCGTLGADGVVTAPPSGSSYSYVTTDNGVDGAGQLPGEGGTNGSLYTTSAFEAAAGDDLSFFFNYITSDGSGFADYSWAGLFTAALDPVAILFTARTQPTGTIVPGFDLPGVEATLNPASVPIIDGAPVWSPLGADSGECFSVGCGFTGWINSTYEIAAAGSYVLRFGVTNWDDTGFQSGMAFSGITVGGVAVSPGATRTGGSISIGNVQTGKFTAAAGTSLTSGIIDSDGSITIDAGGPIATNNLIAGDFVDLTSDGNIGFANALAGTEFDFDAGGSVTGGTVTAGATIEGDVGGDVSLGNLVAGFAPGGFVDDDIFSVGIVAAGSTSVGNVQAAQAIGFGTFGNLATGNLSAGNLVMTLVDGNITTGSIATTGASGQVYMADASMCATGGGCGSEGDFNPDTVLALDPVATGGSITINGPVSTGLFRAAAGSGLTTQAITAGDIHASAGGTASINGIWNSSDLVTLSSNNIDISSTGGINAAGFVTLSSTNATQALIGDGLTGTGYALSNAELGRVSGYQVQIFGRGDASAAIDMLVGDLTVTGPLAGSTIEGADGALVFAVGDAASSSVGGVIRVNGDIAASGFGSGNAIEFHADRFELDAATGSIGITSSGSTLGGELGLYADRIHVASGTILNQLAANPTYSGYQQDLNDPADVQRPEGVIRADTLWIESANLQDILIQNTGTHASTGTPAGFVVREAFVNEDFDVAGPAGSINLVVNGQVVGNDGTLTGVAARDALVPEGTDITPFTANSTINGCPLTGACIIVPPAPPPVVNVVDNQIDLITSDPFGDSDFGNEDSIDDGEEGGDGAENPISPPQPLFDTRPLIPSSEINDPVSGTGNPALLGGDQCEEDENGQCPVEPVKGDSQ